MERQWVALGVKCETSNVKEVGIRRQLAVMAMVKSGKSKLGVKGEMSNVKGGDVRRLLAVRAVVESGRCEAMGRVDCEDMVRVLCEVFFVLHQ